MKRKYLALALGLLTIMSLSACQTEKKGSSASTSTADTQVPNANTSTSSTVQREISLSSMDIDALMQGNYDSILGTWQNSQGNSLVFNSKGLVADSQSLLGRGKITDGIFETGYVDATIGDVTLLMIPKGTQANTTETDTTDSTRDRMIVISQETTADVVDVYYRLTNSATSGIDPLKNTETGVQLDSGPKTIDYANSILGENNWRVIEGNYTRTESIPYNILEGDDNAHYTIYQNGVIINADYQIVYQP
ncbi:TPA: translation initiation factor 1 (IF-1) [Streptococcus suis]|nr:translation initiation factor 1 (IF-1) [Streptococcus suis]HEM5070776.1 translation initiation factor 1 (IF-1) [Streptococcus suis]HEM5089414.1 translation initiation factor 1 (IF-1) [Streptococcus suis]HEM5098675.1 translation initiation factor 1 (IF-1) [Streptococcus suis]HEM5100786.1 translation initiation factor 1 (IF-1) [Streptococcus suis]